MYIWVIKTKRTGVWSERPYTFSTRKKALEEAKRLIYNSNKKCSSCGMALKYCLKSRDVYFDEYKVEKKYKMVYDIKIPSPFLINGSDSKYLWGVEEVDLKILHLNNLSSRKQARKLKKVKENYFNGNKFRVVKIAKRV